ncbi:MAG: endoglucanase A [Planctomycetes bacterium]|nr:endoglucanase A [Planctomycetota bacterium]
MWRVGCIGLAAIALSMSACGGDGSSSSSSPSGPTPAPPVPPGDPLTPDDPGPADVQIRVDSGQDVHAISPYIYGKNHHDWSGSLRNLALSRVGGNRWTAFNWENNASNAGTDWLNQNDNFLGGGDVPGEAVRSRVSAAFSAGGAVIVTVPIAGYAAADKQGGGDVNQTPNYLSTRFRVSVAKKNAAFAYPPALSDSRVYQDEFVWWLESQFPQARTDPRRTIFYSLDNEPDLWSDTHPRIHPDPATYEELRQRSIEYAAAVKDVVPQAVVFGPVNYGWQGFVNLQGAPDANGRDFLQYYLAAMAQAHQAQGRRLLDVLDLHWYPEARGGGVRIIEDAADSAVAAARVQAPRSLWDPAYTETSWIASSIGQPIRLIPRVREKTNSAYPGTKLAFTEYYYGGGAHISGGIAQADVLGVFAREDVFAATLWHMGSTDDRFINGGFAMYRNYDGADGSFGDTSVRAVTSNVADTSVYAGVDAGQSGRMVIIAINKTASARSAGIAITHTQRFSRAEVYRLTAASPTPQRVPDASVVLTNAFTIAMPAMSVTTLVLRAAE